ncbi:unnamed protein product [Ectocarpus sp. 12 AP-2014]
MITLAGRPTQTEYSRNAAFTTIIVPAALGRATESLPEEDSIAGTLTSFFLGYRGQAWQRTRRMQTEGPKPSTWMSLRDGFSTSRRW